MQHSQMIEAKSEPYFNNALENARKKLRSQPPQDSSVVTFTNLHSFAYVRVESHVSLLDLGRVGLRDD